MNTSEEIDAKEDLFEQKGYFDTKISDENEERRMCVQRRENLDRDYLDTKDMGIFREL